MISKAKAPFISAYVNSFSFDGKEFTQYIVDVFDTTAKGGKESKYRSLFLDEVLFTTLGFNDEKVLRSLAGREIEFEYNDTLIRKSTEGGFSYNMTKWFLVNILNMPKKA